MNIIQSIKSLNQLQLTIWISSLCIIFISFVLFKTNDMMTLIASLIGATALIFVGKGDALGQLLTMVFALFYSIISYECRYYGEMMTYAGMTLPSALFALIEWLRHPYSQNEVKVKSLTYKDLLFLFISAIVVTIVFGYILVYFDTANIVWSIMSVTTSYIASMLTILRSPYYAIAYCFNDIILIILWILASMNNINYIPMILCFIIFFINDSLGFIQWQNMKKRQTV